MNNSEVLELVSKELNHLAAILQIYSGSFMNLFIEQVNWNVFYKVIFV